MSKIAWHYTTGANFIKIANGGFLLPTSAYIDENEKPILWFSTAKYWEQTACKMTSINGEFIRLSMQETMHLGGGLVRFGLSANQLIEWKQLPKKAGMRKAVARALELKGKEQRATSTQWRGSLSPIAINDCASIQVMDESMQWVEVSA